MGLFGAARMGNRMGARQQYRTMARMHRRRSYLSGAMGQQQDFSSQQDGSEQVSEAPTKTATTQQLEELSELRAQGIITDEEFSNKKKQILGI